MAIDRVERHMTDSFYFKFGLPIHAIGVGEKVDDLRPLDARAVARAIAGLPPE